MSFHEDAGKLLEVAGEDRTDACSGWPCPKTWKTAPETQEKHGPEKQVKEQSNRILQKKGPKPEKEPRKPAKPGGKNKNRNQGPTEEVESQGSQKKEPKPEAQENNRQRRTRKKD